MTILNSDEGIEFDFGKNSFKRRTASRFINRKISAAAFAKEAGVTIKTLYNWAHEYDIFVPMNKSEMSLIQKMKIVITFGALPEEERGEFLRKKGLFDSDIEVFKDEISKSDDKSDAKRENALESAKIELRETQKALRKTEKALIEAKALLELKKKLEGLFGSEDEDPKPPSK